MSANFGDNKINQLTGNLSRLWNDEQDRMRIAKTIQALNTHYDLSRKMANEPEVEGIIEQMVGRLANSYPTLTDVQNKRILDIACGSNTSKLPASFFLSSLFSGRSVRANRGYTTLFEPWFCRILLELGATPVGVDFGDLEGESFIHHHVDLGKQGALDFLPDHSFDGIQDSRLFGSPEFTAEFPHQADRLKVAQEIVRQELRLLKMDGIIIHSDAAALLR
jgi:hypothetical protein